jgi:hypothetical protein
MNGFRYQNYIDRLNNEFMIIEKQYCTTTYGF